MEDIRHSRAPSGVPLREYYRAKSEHAAAAGTAMHQQQQHEQQPRRRSPVAKLLSRLKPGKAGSKQAHVVGHKQPETAETSARSSSSTAAPADSGGGGSAGIPAFRPASPPPDLLRYAPPFVDGDTSPGKAQLQAVRALARRQQQQQQQQQAALKQQQQHPPAAPPQGTPGLSEVSSVGRAINAQIEDTLAGMFMVTPPEVTSGGSAAGGGSANRGGRSSRSSQRRQQRQHGRTILAPEAPAGEQSSGGARYHLPRSGHNGSEGTLSPPELRAASASPLRVPPQPPPPPALPLTAMGTSSALEPQSIKSPMFMSRRQRSMVCELDDPGSAIAYPKAHRRTSAGRRLLAAFLPCFVPPPSTRSPAPSLRAPGGRHTPSSQGASPPPGPVLAFGMDPLRQSLVELTLSDPVVRSHICTSLAEEAGAGAGSGPAGSRPRQSPLYGDLLGLQAEEDEEAQANMASPVLPSRAASSGGTPAALALGSEAGEGSEEGAGEQWPPAAVLAKRNLMNVLRSREAGTVRLQQAVQQHQQVHQQQSHALQHHVQHPLHPGQQQQQQQQQVMQRSGSRPISAHHLQPWQRQRQAAPPAAPVGTKATHVSVAQLLAVQAAEGQPQPHRWGRAAGGGTGRQPSTGAKRGREALGVSRAPSDDAPAFTPKRPLLRDLSKPSYRSEDLHRVLSPLLANLGSRGGGGIGRPASGGSGHVTPAPGPGSSAGLQSGSAAAGSRPGSAQALRRSASMPASPAPVRAAGAAGATQGKGGSMPSSPLLGTRLTKAAAVRAAASQRKLQEREAQLQAVVAKSPDRWLRAAAAQGLSLREAAVFASPGKSARPHYHPLPAVDRQQAGQQAQRQRAGTGAAAAAAMATPGGHMFDSFAAGEAGVEPYSARLFTAERPRPGVGGGAAATARAAAAPQPGPASELPVGADGSGTGKVDLDLAAAAGSNEYMEMLRRLEQGLKVEHRQLEPFTRPTPPPLPADWLAAAAAAAMADAAQPRRSADGADTVRPRQEAASSSRPASSRTAEYSLHAELSGGPGEAVESPEPRAAAHHPMPLAAQHPVPLTPHHNALYGKALTPTKSSPLAQQRMVSMEAALRAGQAQHAGVQQQRRRHPQQPPRPGEAPVAAAAARQQGRQQPPPRRGPQPGGSNGGSSSRQTSSAGRGASTATASASISFGSAGCAASTGGNAAAASGSGTAAGTAAGGREAGAERLRRLEALLLQAEAAGEHFTLAQLHSAGFSSHDVNALKQSLWRQG
ncbi:hypothetical protein ABPG75_011610 [Micractinium tetrahymenae]